MSLKTETKNCAGIEITVTQFPPRKALTMGMRVAKAVGPIMMSGVPLDSGLAVLFADVTPDELWKLCSDLLPCATAQVEGQAVQLNSGLAINQVFMGNLPALTEAMIFAAEVNFANYFEDVSALKAIMDAGGDKEQSASDSERG